MLIVLLATTGRLPRFDSHILFPIFLSGSKQCTYVSLPVTLAEIFCTFKIHFRIKCALDSDMPTDLAISRFLYLPSVSIISLTFETLVFSDAVTGHPDFVASLTDSIPV